MTNTKAKHDEELPDPNPPTPTVPLIGPQPPMIWDEYKIAFQERVAQARRNAYNTALRPSNDHLEAAMFLAMMIAYFDALPDGADPIPVPESYTQAREQTTRKPGDEPEGEADEPPKPTRRGRHE